MSIFNNYLNFHFGLASELPILLMMGVGVFNSWSEMARGKEREREGEWRRKWMSVI